MQLYVVGGAVRDRLLGLPAADRDWVAVGATPEELLALGYKPVGKDFPVFLHPQTGEEVALARTERKTGRGYTGFAVHAAPGVTLEEDLARRDLTINAIAQAEDGTLIDPYGGQADLRDKVLRHVSPAFEEDPVRLLRLARFAARFADFAVAPETMQLLCSMVAAGELDALVPERVWQELARGLLSHRPGRMLAVLHDSGAMQRLLPELVAGWRGSAARLDAAAGCSLPVAWALLLAAAGLSVAEVEAVSGRLKAPNDCRELAVLLAREGPAMATAQTPSASERLALFNRCDAFRRAPRFQALLQAAALLGHGVTAWTAAFEAAQSVDAAAVVAEAAARGAQGAELKQALDTVRTHAVAKQPHAPPGAR